MARGAPSAADCERRGTPARHSASGAFVAVAGEELPRRPGAGLYQRRGGRSGSNWTSGSLLPTPPRSLGGLLTPLLAPASGGTIELALRPSEASGLRRMPSHRDPEAENITLIEVPAVRHGRRRALRGGLGTTSSAASASNCLSSSAEGYVESPNRTRLSVVRLLV